MGFAGVARENSTKFYSELSMRQVDTGKKVRISTSYSFLGMVEALRCVVL